MTPSRPRKKKVQAWDIRRSSRPHIRGTATVEAVMMLTVFIIIWAGVSYVGQLYESKLASQGQARSCAWEIALSACEEIPQECSGALESSDALSDKSERLKRPGKEGASGQKEGDEVQDLLNSEVDGLFMKRISTSGIQKVTQPPLLGGKTVEIGGSYSLPCNAKAKSLGDRMQDMMDGILGKLL